MLLECDGQLKRGLLCGGQKGFIRATPITQTHFHHRWMPQGNLSLNDKATGSLVPFSRHQAWCGQRPRSGQIYSGEQTPFLMRSRITVALLLGLATAPARSFLFHPPDSPSNNAMRSSICAFVTRGQAPNLGHCLRCRHHLQSHVRGKDLTLRTIPEVQQVETHQPPAR